MIGLQLAGGRDQPLSVLCLGAHCDDIEIGCGGTLLGLARDRPDLRVRWEVFSAGAERKREALASAAEFLDGVARAEVEVHDFRDAYFPTQWSRIKDRFEAIKNEFEPDLILAHTDHDRHQDHRVLCELAWNTWRDHLVLEYEIPKYDGDLGQPNIYVPVDEDTAKLKVDLLMRHFKTQRNRGWFTPETFLGLMRIRAVEIGCPAPYAEAFHARKCVLQPDAPPPPPPPPPSPSPSP